MKDLLSNVSIQVNENIYLKDPESSDLGKKIIEGSVNLIDEIGFEKFTFKKLSMQINSTEASVYRYFESKHKLLLYITSWYWAWLEYQLVFNTANIKSPRKRLIRAIKLLTEEIGLGEVIGIMNTEKLYRIVISESSKSFLVKEVDQVNQEGAFMAYKNLVGRVAEIVKEIEPKYRFPRMLISTIIEGAHNQRFFVQHLPKLTDTNESEDLIPKFYEDLVLSAVNIEKRNNKHQHAD